jgi:hypothetical protein
VKRTFLYIFPFILVLLVGTTYIYNLSQTPTEVDSGDQFTLTNSVSYRLVDSNGETVPLNNPIKPENGKIHKTLEFSHNYHFKGRYALIILVDHKQVDFGVNDKNYLLYPFNTEPNETVEINTSISNVTNSKEVVYLVIFQPNYLLTEKDDFSRALDLQPVYQLRFPLATEPQQNEPLQFDPPVTHSTKLLDSSEIRLLRNIDEFKIMMSGKSEEEIYMSLANTTDNNMNYSIIGFKGWEQVPFYDNKFIRNIQIPPGQRNYYKITLPITDEKVNYQIFAIPDSFRFPTQVIPSPRITIHP